MNELLNSIARIPGVRFTALVTEDGVPVAVPGRRVAGTMQMEESDLPTAPRNTLDPDEVDGCAAVSIGWLDELSRTVAAMSWESPTRVILTAARGTMVMLRTANSVLLTVLDPGLDPEELKLPMDGVAARIQRVLRGSRRSSPAASEPESNGEHPAPALPSNGGVQGTPGAGLRMSSSRGSGDSASS